MSHQQTFYVRGSQSLERDISERLVVADLSDACSGHALAYGKERCEAGGNSHLTNIPTGNGYIKIAATGWI